MWDPRQSGAPVAHMVPAEGEGKRDCWSVGWGHSHNDLDRCVCAGYDNGDVKMFDLRTMSLLWETNMKNGVSRCGLLWLINSYPVWYRCVVWSSIGRISK